MRRCSQLNACWVLPLGRSTQREDASTLIPEVHVGERMKVESWIGNKRDCHCKTFQKHLFCDLSNLCQGGKSKRCDWDRTVRVSQRTCRRLLWTLQTQRSPELFMRIHSTQKITWFDSGYLTLNEGFFFLRKKNLLHSKLPKKETSNYLTVCVFCSKIFEERQKRSRWDIVFSLVLRTHQF